MHARTRGRIMGVLLPLGLAASANHGIGPAAAAGAPTPRPVILELFTSQGCSSCPPADSLLTEMARERTDILAFAYHVTYWDRLGWRDPYSLTAATDRQRSYARQMGNRSVYTPQLIIDGKLDVVGSDRPAVIAAIRAAMTRVVAPVRMQVTAEGHALSIEIGAGTGQGDVILVGYDKRHTTAVGRGENAGRTLEESNVVRSVYKIGEWTGQAASIRNDEPAGERFAVILQSPDGQILGAAVGG